MNLKAGIITGVVLSIVILCFITIFAGIPKAAQSIAQASERAILARGELAQKEAVARQLDAGTFALREDTKAAHAPNLWPFVATFAAFSGLSLGSFASRNSLRAEVEILRQLSESDEMREGADRCG